MGKGKEVYVDFVGENSTNKKKSAKAKGGLNPTRLFICGLAPGVTKTNLKEMFPKASHADIPQRSKKKGTSYGFVQFASPGDAKAAFDAAKDLSIAGHKITVLFAKMTEVKPEILKKKAEKRKAREEKKKDAKKVKTDDSEEKENVKIGEDEDNDEESDEEDETVEAEGGDEDDDDDDDEDDNDNDDNDDEDEDEV